MARLIQVQAPMQDVVSVAEAKSWLHIDTADDDVKILTLIRGATQLLEGGGGHDGLIGRALMPQTWRLELTDWPGDFNRLSIPMPPLIAVTGVTYLDTEAAVQTLASTIYRVVDSGAGRGLFMLADDQTWPTCYSGWPDAVRIVFDCGYQDASSPANNPVPEPIRQAILFLVQSWYDHPGESIPEVVHSLIAPYKANRLGVVLL